MTAVKKRGLGLYGTNPHIFHSRETLMSGDRVFVGNQLDDFGVCGALTNGSRILLLGTGYGGAFRSVIAGIENAEVVALDYDHNILVACKAMMTSFFPELDQISYVHGDASKLPEHVEGLFDVICVDVYSSQGYPAFVFESTFWQMIRESLTPKGVVLMNAFGLPTYLRPLEGQHSVQARVLKSMQTAFSEIYALPSRRNLTFVACREGTPDVRKYAEVFELQGADKLIADLLPLRFSLLQKVQAPENVVYEATGSLEEIDAQKERRWDTMMEGINRGLTACGYAEVSRADLESFISDKKRAGEVTEWLLKQGAAEADFIPVTAGAYASDALSEVEWYLEWVIERGESLMQTNKAWFVNVALWQALSMVNNPYVQLRHLDSDFAKLIDHLGLR